jgi:hypothetical protein
MNKFENINEYCCICATDYNAYILTDIGAQELEANNWICWGIVG